MKKVFVALDGMTAEEVKDFLTKHSDDTFQLLNESAIRGESSVPSEKMAQTRSSNFTAMQKANQLIGVTGGTMISYAHLCRRLADAESDAISFYIKVQFVEVCGCGTTNAEVLQKNNKSTRWGCHL